MTARRFRTRSFEVEAIRFDGENFEELFAWTNGRFLEVDKEDRRDDPDCIAEVFDGLLNTWVGVNKGQWIVRGVRGEFYPYSDYHFNWKYEEVPASSTGSY